MAYKFQSPFIYTTFTSTSNKSVIVEYQERVLDIYKSKYEGLKDMNMGKIKIKIFKLEQQEIEKKKKEEEERKKKEEEEQKKKEEEENKEEKKDDDKKEDDKDKDKDKDKGDKKDENDDGDKKDKKEEKNDDDIVVSKEEKKLMKALELLENEYIGREHEFYVFLCGKYEIGKVKDEFLVSQYCTPLLNDYLSETNDGLLMCFECNNMKLRAEFDLEEFANGTYLACRKCAPDRDAVKSLKWHQTFRSTRNLRLIEKDHVAKVEGNGHQYACIDDNPVKSGIHCWRWKSNKHRTWCMWGVSYLKEYTAV